TFSYDGSDGPKNVFFAIMDEGGVSRQGGDVEVDRIYFGLDEPIGLRGDDWGSASSLPDFTFAPEPASLILLSLAGLFLRRR
ncbi:MAG TPA: PEP-CTERM sorting domain-containing protein, partial [Phycisphaerae bacterium]|nr:PEP-CTERM sorting domain-containing protein [Phycisphaerae bacterium]